ncbi:MAG: DUF1559 domain-containing protein [Candidatus Pacebacteria bacterium]|nr:DUF1559 domain-containing protein [Candidatus Paceibacterota bacterium]
MRRRHFTLLELLVVVAVIAVLSALLVPGLVAARERARGVLCTSNLRQVGVLITMYAGDNDDCSMPADFGGAIDSWINFACAELNASPAMFACPAMKPDECFDPYGGNIAPYNAVTEASYVMNTVRRGQWTGAVLGGNPALCCGFGDGTAEVVHFGEVGRPHKKIMVVDALQGITSQDARGIVYFLETDHGPIPDDRDVGIHHSGGYNALYGDGHVKHMGQSNAEQWAAVQH